MEVLGHIQSCNWTTISLYLVAVVIGWLFYTLIIRPLSHPLVKQLQGPRFVLSGNLREFFSGDIITNGIRWAKQYGHMLRYYSWFGGVRLMIMNPEGFKHVLVTNSKNYKKNPYVMRFLRHIMRYGLITTDGSFHAANRKLINPAFGTDVLKKMLPKFSKKVDDLSNLWKLQMREHTGEDRKIKVCIDEDFMNTTLDIIGECALSYEFDSIHRQNEEVSRAFHDIASNFCFGRLGFQMPLEVIPNEMVHGPGAHLRERVHRIDKFDLLLPFWSLWPTKRNKTMKKYMKTIREVVKTAIREKEKKFESAKDEELDALQKDLLGVLMSARDERDDRVLSDEELQDHVVTFILAGHETTSVGLTWLFLHLAQNLEVQERLRDEVLAYSPGDNISIESIDKMEYLNAVIKETLRLSPPVPAVHRECLQDDVICGHFVPAGTPIHLAIGSAMRLPEYWDDPNIFKPERFMDNIKINPYCWIPFILGNRMCIGYRMALLEMKAMTALLIKRFKFSWIPGYTYTPIVSVTMKPDPPLQLFVEPVFHI